MVFAEYMQRAIELAETARGKTGANPLVGAVIVKDQRIIAEGVHREFGLDHAEVDALKNAQEPTEGSDLYVTLEPCSHYGKTPPCVEAIRNAGIKRVIAATIDPNPLVNGSGVKMLREAGIDVVVGVAESEARKQNEVYFKYITTGLPFVTLKVAQTLDGFIADCQGNSKWITSEDARRRVHELRSRVDAILIGSKTARMDDPVLSSHGQGNDPLRIVVVGKEELPKALKINDPATGGETIVATTNLEQANQKKTWRFEKNPDGRIDPEQLLRKAGQEGIAHILVEGGANIFSQFIDAGLVDKFVFVIAPRILGNGIASFMGLSKRSIAETFDLEVSFTQMVGQDLWIEAYPRRSN